VAEILLFHHAHGLTEGLDALAERLRAQGHVVHTPDVYAGATFARLDDGLAHAQRIGHDAIEEVARRAARTHRSADVTIGFSLGTFPAQLLAQELRRVRACALVGGALPPAALGGQWRHDVSLQVHLADPDEWVEPHEIESLLEHAPHAEVFRYRGRGHMFADPSSPDYDADAADAFEERLGDWLSRVADGEAA
jgi:dienelactone hydrolase